MGTGSDLGGVTCSRISFHFENSQPRRRHRTLDAGGLEQSRPKTVESLNIKL